MSHNQKLSIFSNAKLCAVKRHTQSTHHITSYNKYHTLYIMPWNCINWSCILYTNLIACNLTIAFRLKIRKLCAAAMACNTSSAINFLPLLFLYNIQANYIPLCLKSSIFCILKSVTTPVCVKGRRIGWIYFKFWKQKDFEWSITVSVLHFKAVCNKAAVTSVIGVKNFNWITMVEFKGWTMRDVFAIMPWIQKTKFLFKM